MSDNGKGNISKRPKPRDYRCRHCGRLLFRCWLVEGSFVEIRCRCGRMSIVQPGDIKALLVDETEIENVIEYY